jgi:hypothetical protein
VAAGGHGRQTRVLPFAAREQVADRIDAHAAAGFLHPAHEELAALAVEVGQCESADAALVGGAELGELHQRIPESLWVDRELGGAAGRKGHG